MLGEHCRESLKGFKRGDKEELLPVDVTHVEKGQDQKLHQEEGVSKVSSALQKRERLTPTFLRSDKILSLKNGEGNGTGEPQLGNLKAAFSFLAKVSQDKGKDPRLPNKASTWESQARNVLPIEEATMNVRPSPGRVGRQQFIWESAASKYSSEKQ